MGGFDDHVEIIGDWTHSAPPFSEAYFSSIINDSGSIYVDQTDLNLSTVELDGASNSNALAEPKTSYCGGFRERMAARAGFNPLRLNTENIIKPPEENRSPYLTIPPGLSPTYLLDSPVFLSNSQVLPSPTTGKFPFAPNGNNNQNSTLLTDDSDKGKENTFQDVNASSFAFKPVAESSPFSYSYSVYKVNPPAFAPQSFPAATNICDTSILNQSIEPSNRHFQNNSGLIQQANFSNSQAEINNVNNLSSEQSYNAFGVQELSPPLDEPEKDDGERRNSEDPNLGGGPAEDGYNWRKYGQKPVKGSDYPRSYYKCTHPNCPVKKKVERSIEGHITEIIYKAAHNHPKPLSNHRSPLASSNPLDETQLDYEQQSKTWSTMQENLEGNGSSTLRDQSGVKYESLDRSSTLSNDEDDDHVTHGSVSLGYDGEGEELESKRRRIESYGSDMVGASRAIREPRVVVQTTSDVDILDDGYRWRKYGQKVVKGNPNPRSYYKCTSPNCNVRKHVERASHDLKSVITTYEGKHNHDVPAARNSSSSSSSSSSHINSGGSNPLPAQQGPNRFHRPGPSHSMGRFERHQLGSFSLPNRAQLGSTPGFGYGMNQVGLASMGMAGLGHQSIGHQARTMNDVAFMVPKMEPVADSGMNPSNASAVYKQLMSRLPPLGPQM